MCVVYGWFCPPCTNRNWGEGNSGKTLWLWPHSSILTDNREFKSLFSASRMGVKRLRSEENLEWRNWWEQSVFTERWWREVIVIQLDSKEKWLLSGEAHLDNKLFISNLHKITYNRKCTYMPTWHTCQPLFIFTPTIPVILVGFHLYVSIIIRLSKYSLDQLWWKWTRSW